MSCVASSTIPNAAVAAVVTTLRSDGSLSEQTVARLEVLMCQFAGFVERGARVLAVDAVTPEMVLGFVEAPTVNGAAPGASLQYFRRLAVRTLFRVSRELRLTDGDPSIDVILPPRRPGSFRPLEDDEIDLCRAAAVGAGLRPAVAWALCEATARTGELPWLVRADLDLDGARVWMHGSARTTPRWGLLTEWGAAQLTRRVNEVDAGAEASILGGGVPGSALAQSSAVGLISRTLTRVGLGEAPGVRASSVAAWSGRKVFDETGRIDLAAARLGMRSLDRTARFIGWDWDSTDG